MTSHTRIKQKIVEIEESLELIKSGIPDSFDEFASLGLVKDGIYKRLEFCIQNIIDILSMIYSTHKLGVPSSLDDVFGGIRKAKIFSSNSLSVIEEMKGLRNILIHKYGKVDDSIVYELLIERLDDFDKIIKETEKVIMKLKK